MKLSQTLTAPKHFAQFEAELVQLREMVSNQTNKKPAQLTTTTNRTDEKRTSKHTDNPSKTITQRKRKSQ